MTPLELIGAVGAASLHQRLDSATDQDGVARYMLDRLSGSQVAAIVKALLLDSAALSKISIKMPRKLVEGQGLPESVLTDERTVALRHSECPTPALLIANTDDDQGTSLQDVTLLGAKFLTAEPALWVQAASSGLELPDNQIEIWKAALAGLTAAEDWSLQQIANYMALTRSRIEDESKPLIEALGWALPALQLPRESGHFIAMRPKDQAARGKWKKLYEKLVADRHPLLMKQRRPGQFIESDELRAQWESVRDEVQPSAHSAVEAFISAPPKWSSEVDQLIQFEWEVDGIFQLFSGLRQKKMTLAEETLDFYEFDLPDRLTDADREYLEQLKKSKLREPRDDDRDFFEAHREELSQNRGLRAKWDRFIFGRPIECSDFLEGLMLALERLYSQARSLAGPRSLEIRTAKQTKGQWLELNADVATAFAVRYRGLPELTGPNVSWDTSHLFTYEKLLEQAERRKKYRRNDSTSRNSLQIKFEIVLKVVQGAIADRTTVQLIWTGQPNAIGLECPGDLQRLETRPFMLSSVSRQSVSRKGALQSVSLSDVSTLEPAFGKDSGSLIPKLSAASDLARQFPQAVKTAVASNRISKESGVAILEAWSNFHNLYTSAIKSWRNDGLATDSLLLQATSYGDLLDTLAKHAPGDLNRQELWQPILSVGCIAITGGAPSAIVAPWHPMRMAALAVKARAVTGLIAHVLTAEEVNFGDPRLFFADLRSELSHPWYPEVAVGYVGAEPVLLAETSTVNDYSLMERPVRDPSEAATDVDPREASRQIRALIERYLELQPHECSNLSIMLYNCDAAGLPLETVNALGSVNDQDEVHCNVLVRHRDRGKLSRVYGDLLEKSEGDPDALVVSETSRNFMSKLRIGVMLDTGNGGGGEKRREVDVAFLHDVVSRQAKEAWFDNPATPDMPDFREHVPARWSYKRVSGDDELKATNFLVCPRQPKAGWSYLDAVAGIVRRQSHSPSVHMLPARQISFQDQSLKEMFDDVHSLAEWVATYDDLLDKRQLKALGINVIRYRRQRTHGRNMIVSSTAELRILKVLVRKRLGELSLGLPDDRLAALADRLINDALAISGDIVLRAAKRGVSAGELIGLVLSRALVAEELGSAGTVAWFLLDDYAEWLGQKEQGIADILALSIAPKPGGGYHLRVVVTEAKYIGASQSADARRTSKQQLRQTLLRMEDALFGDPGRLDRDLWLSRIADLLLDGTIPVGQSHVLEAVRDGIRRGVVPIDLRGYSHVFVSNPPDGGGITSEQESLTDIKNGLQEIYARQELRSLIKAYDAGTPLLDVRNSLGDERPWTKTQFREPAPRVSWTTIAKPRSERGKDVEPLATEPIKQPSQVTTQPAVSPSTDVPGKEEAKSQPVGLDTFSALVVAKASQQTAATEADEAWLKSTQQKLRTALLGYGLQAKITGSRITPNAALVRFMGSDRLRVEDIEAKQSALLTTHGLRLVAISPLPGEIVVAVARPQRQTVSLWDVWARRELNVNAVGLNTSFVLGLKELDGEILYLNLGRAFGGEQQHEPHTLIAGATGSGKSVLIQALILDIAATNPSRLAHIYLVDPKMGVDYSAIERLPHLQGGIIVEQDRAISLLDSLADEMERRYELFRSQGARDLKTYNAKVEPAARLPMIFLIHDEFAEWMLTEHYKDSVAATVQRIGVKARAAGMHLIFAAQRPDANVMPVQLRDNLGNRLILKVASVGTSEIALGTKGAESLLGLGHLAARLGGQVIYAQAPFLSDEDIELVVETIRNADEATPLAA